MDLPYIIKGRAVNVKLCLFQNVAKIYAPLEIS